MATQGPTTTATARNSPAAMTSRLAQMQMRFQQRQQQERDQRKVEMISTSSKTATASSTISSISSTTGSTTIRSSAAAISSSSTTTSTSVAHHQQNGNGSATPNGDSLSASLGAGKVRQMFDERRHRVAGIDKSYPLQPIQQQQQQQQQPQQQPTSKLATSASNGNGSVMPVAYGNGTSKVAVNTNGIGVGGGKTRVPPISASTKARLAMQQRAENGNGENLRNVSFDDNENLLDDEKFPDTISFDDDLSTAVITAGTNTAGSMVTRKPLSNVVGGGTPGGMKLNGSSGHQPNMNSLKLKPVPGRTPVTPSLKGQQAVTSTPHQKLSASSVALRKSSGSPSRTVPPNSSPVGSAKSSSSRSSSGANKSAQMALSSTQRKPSVASSVRSAPSPSIDDSPVPPGLARCTICGRNFAEDRLAVHKNICQKTKSKKRKTYDATKHRVQGTDAEKYVIGGKKKVSNAGRKSISSVAAPTVVANAAATAAGGKKADWRRKHEEFIQAIRAAKEMQAHLAKGGKLSDLPPPPPSENPDYVQCPHCSRRFNQTAAERHIPKCATMLHNKPKPNQSTRTKRF